MPKKGMCFLKREKGECYDCAQPAIRRQTRCKKHAAKHREGLKRVSEKREKEGRCPRCGVNLSVFDPMYTKMSKYCPTCSGRTTYNHSKSNSAPGEKDATNNVPSSITKLQPNSDV
jgi:hypothetical protein